MKTKRIVTNAMFIAMYFVLSFFSIKTGNMKITIDSLPIIVGSALLGPIDGMIIGLFGSLLDQLYNYGFMVTTILWILPAGIRGLIVGCYSKKKNYNLSIKQATFITVLSALIVTFLNTVVMYLDSKIMGYYSYAYVFGMIIPRIISGIIIAVILGILLPYILIPLKKIIK